MKPIIVTKDADGRLNITEEELELIIEKAYNEGKSDVKMFVDDKSNYFPFTERDHMVITCETPKVVYK